MVGDGPGIDFHFSGTGAAGLAGYGLIATLGSSGQSKAICLAPDTPALAHIKGGSFLRAPNYCRHYRPAARQPQDRGLGINHVGFRIVLRQPPKQTLLFGLLGKLNSRSGWRAVQASCQILKASAVCSSYPATALGGLRVKMWMPFGWWPVRCLGDQVCKALCYRRVTIAACRRSILNYSCGQFYWI